MITIRKTSNKGWLFFSECMWLWRFFIFTATKQKRPKILATKSTKRDRRSTIKHFFNFSGKSKKIASELEETKHKKKLLISFHLSPLPWRSTFWGISGRNESGRRELFAKILHFYTKKSDWNFPKVRIFPSLTLIFRFFFFYLHTEKGQKIPWYFPSFTF